MELKRQGTWWFIKLIGRLKSGARFGSEIILVVVAVLACFIFFLIGLRAVFPVGDPAQFWFRTEGSISPAALPTMRGGARLDLPEEGRSESGEPVEARLTFVQNEVKKKRSEEIAWSYAREGLNLFDRDAVQTLTRSAAIVTFDQANYIEMGENSLIIIKRMERDRILKEKRSVMAVVDGSFRGKLNGSGSENVRLQVSTPTGVAEVNAKDSADRQVDFKVHVNPDRSSTITVYQGVAKVKAQGVVVEVKENQATHIGLTTPPETPKSILGPVNLFSPKEGDAFFYRDFPPEVTFSWSSQEGAARYHLEIAKDVSFRERVLDEVVTKNKLLYGNLNGGGYLWRVSAIDLNQVEGRWSKPGEIKVVQNRVPPALKILYPKEDRVFNEKTIWIVGESAPNSKVYVNGKTVARDESGRFKIEFQLKKGINLILVESVDPAGNASFQKRVISRKF